MRFSVVCLVVWPELWLTRGDPRLGKRPFIESIALSPYTPISPGALLAYAIPQSSLSCSSNNHIHADSRTQAPSRQTFHHHQPTQQPISSYQSHHEPATDSPLLLIFGWSATDTFHWKLSVISPIDRLTAGPYPKGQGFSRPLR